VSWTDKNSLRNINQLKEDFGIKTFVETGTFRGVNAKVQSFNFDSVITCELLPDYYLLGLSRLSGVTNVVPVCMSSPFFLKSFIKIAKSPNIFYLDAHFYDASLPKEKRFLIKEELKSLSGCKDSIIVIHDFDNGELGCLEYDGIKMGMNVVGGLLKEVNPNFYYYTNKKEHCDIITKEDVIKGSILGVDNDEYVLDTVKFIWSNPIKTYRGFLYCVPRELNLLNYNLRRF
jgi:hypothetical protein